MASFAFISVSKVSIDYLAHFTFVANRIAFILTFILIRHAVVC